MVNTESQFVSYIQSECDKHGVKLELRPVGYLVVSRKFRCTGFFDPYDKVLRVATGYEKYFHTLVHEYAHMTQWLDPDCTEWKVDEMLDSGTKMEAWLMGHNVRSYKKCIAAVRDLELDNEKRTVDIIKTHNLEIDIDDYVRKANCYVLLHNRMMKTRKWPSSRSIYRSEILEVMSPRFDMQYDKNSKEVDKLFERYGH
jgi:hypothetical protein